MTWIHFSPTKALISKSVGNVMAVIFCDIQGIILNHFVPPKTSYWKLLCDSN